jgi:hypothetical protein
MAQRIDPYRVRMLIDLGQIRPERRDGMRPQAEVFLRRAWDDATPEARVSFETWQRGAAGDPTWAALSPPAGGGPPPAFALVQYQVGDPDDPALRGQIVDLGAQAWAPLRDALQRWDTAAILRLISPSGWRSPAPRATARMGGDIPPETAQTAPATAQSGTTPRSAATARPDVIGPKDIANAPKSAPVPGVTWEQAAVGGAVGAVVVGSIFYFIGKRSGGRSPRALGGT